MRYMASCLFAALFFTPFIVWAGAYVHPAQFVSEKTLVTFWASDCAPCQRLLPVLFNFARFNDKTHVILIVAEGREGSAQIPKSRPKNVTEMSVKDLDTSLRAFGAAPGNLPFSAYVREDGSVCESHYGVMGVNQFEDWKNKC